MTKETDYSKILELLKADPDGIQAARIEQAKRCKDSFFYFFKTFWPVIEDETPIFNWHIEYLCDELQLVAERVFKREDMEYNLIVNISPGETKSTICTIMYPVWCWTRDPAQRIITGSYSKDLSLSHSTKSKDLIESDLFKQLFPEIQIRRDLNAKSLYANTKKGQRITTSVMGTITGKHAHQIIFDDPQKREQAKSDVERPSTNEWLTGTLSSRKVSEKLTPTILIMQRLHEEDATAHLAKAWEASGKLKWIRLPAEDRYEISPPELAERYVQDGEYRVMNPGRKPTSVIKEKEAIHTAEDFSGQFGQNPTPAEGNKLKEKWFTNRFRYYNLEAEYRTAKRKEIVWNAVIDGAYTKITKNSASAILIYAQWQSKLYLRAYANWHKEFHELVQDLPLFLNSHGWDPKRSTLYVEPKAIGKSLVQTMRDKGGINIIEDPLPEGLTKMEGKEMRVDDITPFVRAMNTYWESSVNWDAFVNQCKTFPNASHSDMVDTLCMAVAKVDKSGSIWEKESLWDHANPL